MLRELHAMLRSILRSPLFLALAVRVCGVAGAFAGLPAGVGEIVGLVVAHRLVRAFADQAKELTMTMPNELQERIKASVAAKFPLFFHGFFCPWCGGCECELDPKMYERPDGSGDMVRFVCSQCPKDAREVRYFNIGAA